MNGGRGYGAYDRKSLGAVKMMIMIMIVLMMAREVKPRPGVGLITR